METNLKITKLPNISQYKPYTHAFLLHDINELYGNDKNLSIDLTGLDFIDRNISPKAYDKEGKEIFCEISFSYIQRKKIIHYKSNAIAIFFKLKKDADIELITDNFNFIKEEEFKL